MHFVLFYPSRVSDWNNGTAQFLRGIATELLRAGHTVDIFEPADGWSLRNLREQCGTGAIKAFHATYPHLHSTFYEPETLDLDAALDEADVVIVHEWNDPDLIRRIGMHRATARTYRLLFHDTHRRAIRTAKDLDARDLSQYDGVLASSLALRELYEDSGRAERAWTWHAAVDSRIFRPWPCDPVQAFDVVWVGDWGDGERSTELVEFLVEPVRALGLRARVHGVRYPEDAVRMLRHAGIDYAGWLPNFCVPAALAMGRFTVHIPHRLRGDSLPVVPDMYVFEALACRVPLVSAPLDDWEELFEPGTNLLVARDGKQLQRHLERLAAEPDLAAAIADHGLATVLDRHTCARRVEQLLAICRGLGAGTEPVEPARPLTLTRLPPVADHRAGLSRN